MNRRDAKIVALSLACGTLDSVAVAQALESRGVYYGPEDVGKVERALHSVVDGLELRFAKLGAPPSLQVPYHVGPAGAREGRDIPTGEECPECGRPILVKVGRRGRFRGCSGFPACRWRAPLVIGRCPECGRDMVEKSGQHGPFAGCVGYPDCTYTRPVPAVEVNARAKSGTGSA